MRIWPKRNMRRIDFSKYVGCGNDFIIIDDRLEQFPTHNSALVSALCHRQFGIGADGIILVQTAKEADFRMRIFNSDGSEAEMCGNGIRCFKKFLEELGYLDPFYMIETMHRRLKVETIGEQISVEMGDPKDIRFSINIEYKNTPYLLHCIDTGVPHIVLFVNELASVNVNELGRALRNHAYFSPKGTNVNFAQRLPSGKIALRTYERGVEGETLACGTGATATALAAGYQYKLTGPLDIQLSSNEFLRIGFQLEGLQFSNVTMTGPARHSFNGQIDI